MEIKLIGLNGRYTHSTLSLFYLRQVISRQLAADVSLWQYTINDNYFETLIRISHGTPQVICFSVYIWNSERIARLIMDLGQLLPASTIIIGGPEAAAMCQQQPLLAPLVTLVHGEVEGLGAKFFHDLERQEMAPCYQAGGAPDFSLPYQESDFHGPLAHRHIYYESSRGCPYTCSYCLSATSKGVRHLGLDQVKAELDLLLAARPQTIRFIDRTFNAHPERACAIWAHLLNQEGDTCFHFEIAPDRFTEEMFALLARAPKGRFQFEIGLQSTSPAALAAVQRPKETKDALATIKRITELGTIHTHADLILGLPRETKATFARGVNELFAAQPHYIQMGLLKVLPGTPLDNQAEELGLNHRHRPPYELLASREMKHQELTELYWLGEWVEKMYNSELFRPLFTYLAEKKERGFDFFQAIYARCREKKLLERAATPELLSLILAEEGETREDRDLFLEILQFCWLASGRKNLPDHLEQLDLRGLRERLYEQLPTEITGLYQKKERNHFFRKTIFATFSPAVMALAGQPGQTEQLAFQPQSSGRPKISPLPPVFKP
ncbi:MAG: DUF4080 domain-containing protein [Thermodesulfobacteriota bacterium]